MAKKTSHITIRNSNLFCLHCGDMQVIPYLIAVNMFGAMLKQFTKDHKNCAPVWKEPECPQDKPMEWKANWWWQNGERGMSSEALWSFFMGNGKRKIKHPEDPDDFGRCYKLLKAIPEWRSMLNKAKVLSPEWEALIGQWDILEKHYLELVSGKKNDMAQLMRLLINKQQ